MSNTAASTLITEMLDNLSRAGTATTRSGTLISARGLTILNRALSEVAKRHDFVEMKKRYSTSTVASQKTYAFPSNYNAIVDMVLQNGTDSRKLRIVMPDAFEKYVPYPESGTTGVPSVCIPFGDNFDLYPIPDGAYTVRCRATLTPAVITDSATAIDYTPDKDDLVVAGMTYRAFMMLQMFEDAGVWKAEFKALLKDAVLNDEDTHLDWSPKGEGFNALGDALPFGDTWNMPMYRRNV